MSQTEPLSSSLEDYLEAIFHLVNEHKVARVRDVADRLSVSRPSVSHALRHLAEKGLVAYTPYEMIDLTDEGRELARDVVRRHEALKGFLVEVLNVEDALAEETACKMEHVVPPSVIQRFVEYQAYLKRQPEAQSTWIRGKGFQPAEGSEAP